MNTTGTFHQPEARLREEIVEFGRSIFERGLTAGSSGNISSIQSFASCIFRK
jgi:ribulose-5-phosphate 4-epimerase/fuculose-1-phosphate aldolase